MKKLIIFILILSNSLLSQKSGREILMEMNNYWKQINDYSVDIHISVDIPGFKMPDKNVTFYYKEPGLTKIKARGFAIVPKDAVLFKPERFLKKNVQIEIVQQKEKVDDSLTILKIIPPKEEEKMQVYLYVDTTRKVIRKIESIPMQDSRFEMTISYQNVEGFWLPESTRFQFYFTKEFSEIAARRKEKAPFSNLSQNFKEGTILITFKNYRINQNLPDSFFRKK